jgi:hypothetical protein
MAPGGARATGEARGGEEPLGEALEGPDEDRW